MISNKISILWMPPADSDNINAQSLNAREVALRLDPSLFRSTLFYEREPDDRLLNRPDIRLVRLPAMCKTVTILREMYGGHALIAYTDSSPASYLFVHSPGLIKRGARTALHVEAPAAQSAGATGLALFRYKSIARRCDAHFGITEYVARDMRSHGLRPKSILPIGVDTKRFLPPAERRGRIPTVLFAGTVIERKGAHLVVDVAHEVPEAQFLIVGAARGGFDEVLRKRIQERGVANVRMLGPQSQARMVEIMQESDIFLLPSHLEGIPKVTLEAAATGLPCVVFKTYQTPSVIDGLTGFQVANLEEMASRVSLLTRDADLRRTMGSNAVRHVWKFDWNIVAAQWQEAYLQIAEASSVACESRETV
jgi:glycosyltransferase involved in cell wall biosynthesis